MCSIEQDQISSIPSFSSLLDEAYTYAEENPRSPLELVHFRVENDGYTVYNPAPFIEDGVQYLWGRVEKKGKAETGGDVRLFKESEDGVWDQVENSPVFDGMQDPFYCGIVGGKHVMGGVQTYEIPGHDNLGYRTIFYRYEKSVKELMPRGNVISPFAIGPSQMKGIRLVQVTPDLIGVFTRPQGDKLGGAGQIGYFEINSLDELAAKLAEYDDKKDKFTLLPGFNFTSKSGKPVWVGPNQIIVENDGSIFVLGHIAEFVEGTDKKRYLPMTFRFDRLIHKVSDVHIIATDRDYPNVVSKKDDLEKIYYPGGFLLKNGVFGITYGIGDVTCFWQAI